ncbi:MAG: HetZ-related protein 2 [Jaaginema sp. PMC 1079.18]|nr:HetZ-related protein 2 [Jaaginema sp. PMC 1080.18]MEC4850824.1 HetZ-related protein 2 [Jaaginema sp. PMC 1079.18]MEC4867587.1 HetZ-related protein 2 [Jaaginema sp. PMC 1078.18]
MHTLKQGLEELYLMTTLATELATTWHQRLQEDYPHLSTAEKTSIVRWLLGEEPHQLESFAPQRLEIAKRAMEYRYRILRQRYLGVSPTQAYKRLIARLASLAVLRNKIRTWVALSRDRHRAVADVLQEVIQEMLNSDRNIQAAIAWIRQCTNDRRLREALLLTSVEEYCLRPIRNQPLLAYRFVNFLRRSQRSGMTQVPQQQHIRTISEEITLDEGDTPLSLIDNEALETYQIEQNEEERQLLRLEVQEEFEQYLAEKVEPLAVDWLRLYLQGKTQDEIATQLNVPIKRIYRLREKVSYHAVKVFALKARPELVANWLQTSLSEHNLGLTLSQWQTFTQSLNPQQQDLLERLQAGESFEAIASAWQCKKSQAINEWHQLYQMAQSLRNEGTFS